MNILRQKLSPPELGKLWHVSPDKILAWIRSGELKAVDFSTTRGSGRPRYLIDKKDVELFELSRTVVPPAAKQRRRRRRDPSVTEYF